MKRADMRSIVARLLLFTLLIAPGLPAHAEEKFIRIDQMPDRRRVQVNQDGTRIYIGSSEFLVFDENANLLKKIGYPLWGTGALNLFPLTNGWFVRATSGAGSLLTICRPDGSDATQIVGKGNLGTEARSAGEKFLRHDMTGWTSPTAAAIDEGRRIVFAADTTMPPNDDRH